jgi:uncharacterized repeat protein (TIGR02543 family)
MLNGGYVGAYPDPIMVIVSDGDTITEANVPIPTRPNHTFYGWRENNEGALLDREAVGGLIVTEPRSFTAQWQRILLPVTFDLNDGVYHNMTDTVVRIISQGDAIDVDRVPAPTRAGWNFLGWREDDADPLLNRTQVGDLIVAVERSFTAQWEQVISPPDSGDDSGEPWRPDQPRPPRPPASNDLQRQAYLIGTDDGIIRPNANITRAEVATIFFRIITDNERAMYWMQENDFPDVALHNWFNNAVSTMANADVFTGFPNGTFAPNQTITRGEMAAAIVRFTERTNGMNDVDLWANHFIDIDGHWAADYINTAAASGWMQGYVGGTFRPDQAITRAEVAAMVNRMSGRLVESAEDLLPDMLTWPDNANANAWYYLYIQSATNSYTFEWRGANDAFERWITIIPARNWAVLERPDSRPGDILRP